MFPLEGRGHVLHLSNEECTGVGQEPGEWGEGIGITKKLSVKVVLLLVGGAAAESTLSISDDRSPGRRGPVVALTYQRQSGRNY